MGQQASIPTDLSRQVQVIGAGFSRTGTVSFALALESLLKGPVCHSGTAILLREEVHRGVDETVPGGIGDLLDSGPGELVAKCPGVDEEHGTVVVGLGILAHADVEAVWKVARYDWREVREEMGCRNGSAHDLQARKSIQDEQEKSRRPSIIGMPRKLYPQGGPARAAVLLQRPRRLGATLQDSELSDTE
ncbi:hypothetical protein BUE80_DR010924 [Diplocarpon rosae]|nr:hypothetical protein BUE80_DR010924 [Diplocarpon rosae]